MDVPKTQITSYKMDEELDLLFGNASNITIRPSTEVEPDSVDFLISLTMIYSLILIFGLLGNISTCIVIARNRSMHTATNFYLFSLAISDLLLLMCGLPLELYRLWRPSKYPLDEVACITFGLVSEMSTNATVLTITAFTVERYIAICRPFMSHTMSKLSRAVRFIFGVWLIALGMAIPQAIQFGIVTYSEKDQTKAQVCTVKGHGVHQVFVISSFLFFVVPMSVISVLYAQIGLKLRNSEILHPKKLSVESNKRTGTSRGYRSGASQRRVVRMLVAVALSFFVCWAPFHLQRLLAIYGKNLKEPSDTFVLVYVILNNISGVLYFLSTAINPVLYNIMSNKFREAFKTTLSLCCGRRHNKNRLTRTYSALMATRRERAGTADITDFAELRARRLQRLPTATSQLGESPPRPQRFSRRDLYAVNDSSCTPWALPWRLNVLREVSAQADGSSSAVSPRSISNSSLKEFDDELTGEELTTFMYQINCNIGGLT